MKIKSCLLLFVCLCMTCVSFANNIALNDGDKGDKGDGGTTRPPFAPQAAPMVIIPSVQAEQTDNKKVKIDFLEDFGDVTVTVTDNLGRIYHTVHVNTSMDSQLVVNIAPLAPGEYILKIKDGQGILNKSGKFKVD